MTDNLIRLARMVARIKHLWAHHPLITLAFTTACAAFLYFAANTITATIYWMDPAHQDQPLEGWMTPRYVSRSYQLPPDVTAPALLFERGDPMRRESLDTIAARNNISLSDLQSNIDTAAAAWRDANK